MMRLNLPDPAVYDRIAEGLLEDDPAARALIHSAIEAEGGRWRDDITDAPKHWIAITVVRNESVLGPIRRGRAVDAARDWLSGVADGPLIPLGKRGGQWMYLVDAAGLDHLADAKLLLRAGCTQRVYLDTGAVTFLPWRPLGHLLADADEARHLALQYREKGYGAMKIHISDAELAEQGLALPAATTSDPHPIYRPLTAA